MLADYLPVFVLFVLVTVVGLVAMTIPRIVGPSRPSLAKLAPYESGMSPIGPAWKRIPIRFYVTAMLFVIFDVETVFMFPWAVIFDQLLLFGLIEMMIFIFILVVGYYYAWQKGALEWV